MALANQTEWFRAKTIACFCEHDPRGSARITISRGPGPWRCIGHHPPSHPPPAGADKLREALRGEARIRRHRTGSSPCTCWKGDFQPVEAADGRRIRRQSRPAGDWLVLIDGTDVNAVSAHIAERFEDVLIEVRCETISTGGLQSDVGDPRKERHSNGPEKCRKKNRNRLAMLHRHKYPAGWPAMSLPPAKVGDHLKMPLWNHLNRPNKARPMIHSKTKRTLFKAFEGKNKAASFFVFGADKVGMKPD